MPSAERESWDAIVIGSGLGGLSCAAYLAAAGVRTLVLEGHYVAGGNSQAFRRTHQGRTYEFDVGLHYIGECGAEGLITRILRGAGLDGRIRFRPLDEDGFSTLMYPDLTFRVPAGWDRYRERLRSTFPREAEPLGRVVDVLRAVAGAGNDLLNGQVTIERLAAESPLFFEWGLRPVTELFDAHALSLQARAVLLGEQGDYAVPPSRTPTALHAGLTDHYMRGAFYPEGGGQMIAARLVEAIRVYGGEVRTRAPVSRIRVENGRVTGVTLKKTGEEIDAPVVVSNADLKRTIHELVGDRHFSAETVAKVSAYRMSFPLFVVYLVLDVDLGAQGMPNTNYFIWGTYDIERVYRELEAGRIPDEDLVYVTNASNKDPDGTHLAPRGYTNLQIMTLVPREYAVWNVRDDQPVDPRDYHRDSEYRRRKSELAERLIGGAERVVPGIGRHIEWKEAASPVTQERFTHSTGGTSYGIEFAVDQMGPMRIGPETEVRGLFLAGASTPSGHGIASVMRSGVVAAGAVLQKNLMKSVITGEVLGDPRALQGLRSDWDPWRECH